MKDLPLLLIWLCVGSALHGQDLLDIGGSPAVPYPAPAAPPAGTKPLYSTADGQGAKQLMPEGALSAAPNPQEVSAPAAASVVPKISFADLTASAAQPGQPIAFSWRLDPPAPGASVAVLVTRADSLDVEAVEKVLAAGREGKDSEAQAKAMTAEAAHLRHASLVACAAGADGLASLAEGLPAGQYAAVLGMLDGRARLATLTFEIKAPVDVKISTPKAGETIREEAGKFNLAVTATGLAPGAKLVAKLTDTTSGKEAMNCEFPHDAGLPAELKPGAYTLEIAQPGSTGKALASVSFQVAPPLPAPAPASIQIQSPANHAQLAAGSVAVSWQLAGGPPGASTTTLFTVTATPADGSAPVTALTAEKQAVLDLPSGDWTLVVSRQGCTEGKSVIELKAGRAIYYTLAAALALAAGGVRYAGSRRAAQRATASPAASPASHPEEDNL